MLIATSVLLCCLGLTVADEAVKNITIHPPQLAVEVNKVAVFNCTTASHVAVVWQDANGTELANEGRFNWTTNGLLTITNASESDSGNYKCVIEGSGEFAEALLKVYVMPTYLTEGMIILAIDGALLLLFLGCCVKTQVQQRRNISKMKSSMKQGRHS